MEKTWKILITVVVVLCGGTFLVYSALGNAQHYKPVSELDAQELKNWDGKAMKVSGYVQSGTIVEHLVGEQKNVTFVLEEKGKRLRVLFEGQPPDTFKDRATVLALGHLVPAAQLKQRGDALNVRLDDVSPYVFESKELSAKCPSKYDDAPSIKFGDEQRN